MTIHAATCFSSSKKYMTSPTAARMRNSVLSTIRTFSVSYRWARFLRMRSTCSSRESSSFLTFSIFYLFTFFSSSAE